MTPDYPGVICATCGKTHGRRGHAGTATTWYPGTCDICGAYGDVTEPRDFGHLKPTWKAATVRREDGK